MKDSPGIFRIVTAVTLHVPVKQQLDGSAFSLYIKFQVVGWWLKRIFHSRFETSLQVSKIQPGSESPMKMDSVEGRRKLEAQIEQKSYQSLFLITVN